MVNSPFLPAALFATLVVSVAAAVPLADASPALAIVALFGFVASLGGLAYVVVHADLSADPRQHLSKTLERFEERWPKFEREFWAHVAATDSAARKLD